MSLLLGVGWGAYARDKNTSARLCTINAGGLMREGGVFAGHYSTIEFNWDQVSLTKSEVIGKGFLKLENLKSWQVFL